MIRVHEKPACLYLIASAMGCHCLWSPWDFITQRQMDDPGTAEFWEGGRQFRVGVGKGWVWVGCVKEGQAISLISSSMSQVA